MKDQIDTAVHWKWNQLVCVRHWLVKKNQIIHFLIVKFLYICLNFRSLLHPRHERIQKPSSCHHDMLYCYEQSCLRSPLQVPSTNSVMNVGIIVKYVRCNKLAEPKWSLILVLLRSLLQGNIWLCFATWFQQHSSIISLDELANVYVVYVSALSEKVEM